MHLDEHDIARYLDGVVAGEQQEQMEAHLADCAVCCEAVASAYHMLETISVEAPSVAPTPAALQQAHALVPGTDRPLLRLMSRPARWAVAAAVVLGLGLFSYTQLIGPQGSRFRTTVSDSVFEATSPVDGAVVQAVAPVFAWRALPETITYRFVLYREDGTLLWQGDTEATSLGLPDTVRLAPHAAFLWRVEAQRRDGSTTSTQLYVFSTPPVDG